MAAKTIYRFASSDPEDVAWRVEQMHANNAIEGIERNPVLKAYVEKMQPAGLTVEEKIQRIVDFDIEAGET